MGLKIEYNSPVILGFSIAAIAVFTLNNMLGGALSPFFMLDATFDTHSALSYLQLISHPLGHADLEHLWGNLTFLLLLGPVIEEKYGSSTTLMMIFLTALVTGLLHALFANTGLMGASGIVFMFIILVSFVNVHSNNIPLTFIIIAILFIGKEVINSFAADNISQFAHIVGGIFGGIFGLMLNRRREHIHVIHEDF